MLSVSVKPSPASDQTERVNRDFSGLVARKYASMPSIAMLCGTGDGMEIRLSSSASTRSASVGPTELDVASDDFVSPPRKPYSSMQNMYITFSATEETIISEGIPMQVSAEVENGQTKPVYVHVFLDPEITSRRAET
jgi:hypothetical protein